MENWKDIFGYEGLYQISDMGRVKSLKRNYFTGQYYSLRIQNEIILVGGKDKKGYLRVGLCKDSVRTTFKIHRLVLSHFKDNPNNKPQVNHKNGVKTDNRAENLEWADNSDNQIHAYRTGLNISRKGEKHLLSKLSELDVLSIRAMYSSGNFNQTELANKFNVTQANISEIVTKKSWSHI